MTESRVLERRFLLFFLARLVLVALVRLTVDMSVAIHRDGSLVPFEVLDDLGRGRGDGRSGARRGRRGGRVSGGHDAAVDGRRASGIARHADRSEPVARRGAQRRVAERVERV
jgi:hypothetical protein